MSYKHILKGGTILTIGSVVSTLASLLRNIAIARIISVEDFGIASLFALVMSAIEMASNLAVGKIIIQDKNGDDPDFQATGQAFQLLRGIISAVIIFLSAGIVSNFFDVPDAKWAFQTLALIPLIRGFGHMDMPRLQRDMHFSPSVWADSIPQIATLVISIPLAMALKDFSVMVWVLLAHTIIYIILSHWLAVRPYRLAWDTKIVSRIFGFGWPLLLNGLLMFAIFQGDKAIVGAAFSMETLGWYGAAFAFTLAPAMLFLKVNSSLLLPYLSKVQDESSVFELRTNLIIQISILSGMLLTMFFSVFGGDVLILLFGDKYGQGVSFISWLGLVQAVRIAKFGPINSAMAVADTKNPMYANMLRGLAFVAAIIAVYFGAGIFEIVIIGLVGEVSSYGLSLWLLCRKTSLRIKQYIFPSVVCLLFAVSMILFGEFTKGLESWLLHILLNITTWVVAIYICLRLMPEAYSVVKTVSGKAASACTNYMARYGDE